jgi:hypothetical protein
MNHLHALGIESCSNVDPREDDSEDLAVHYTQSGTRVSLDTDMEQANRWFAVVNDGRAAAGEAWSRETECRPTLLGSTHWRWLDLPTVWDRPQHR